MGTGNIVLVMFVTLLNSLNFVITNKIRALFQPIKRYKDIEYIFGSELLAVIISSSVYKFVFIVIAYSTFCLNAEHVGTNLSSSHYTTNIFRSP